MSHCPLPNRRRLVPGSLPAEFLARMTATAQAIRVDPLRLVRDTLDSPDHTELRQLVEWAGRQHPDAGRFSPKHVRTWFLDLVD